MKKILILIALTSLICCKSNEEKDLERFLNDVDPQHATKFSKIPVDQLDFLSILYAGTISYSGFCSVFYIETPDDDSGDISELSKSRPNVIQVNESDSCNLHVGDVFKGDRVCENFIPIPSIKSAFSPLKDFEIDSTVQIFVEEFEFKYALLNSFETKSMNLPAKYEHGFSKGFVVTKKNEIINWILFW